LTIYSPDGDVLLDSGASGWTRPPDAPAAGDRVGARGYLAETIPGDGEYLTGFARTKGFREFRGANWMVAVRQPVADAFAGAHDVSRWIFRLGALFTLAAMVLSWWIASRITRRMAVVTAAAHRIRSGDILSEIPRPPGPGEIESMCDALGGMVDDFRVKHEQLDAENARLMARPPASVPLRDDSA
jgi:HAMP domain-containing protein